MERIFTLEQLERLCAKYQKLLRIQDWRIKIEFVHQKDLDDETEGEVKCKLHAMVAHIKIPSPDSWVGSETFTEQDMQLTLIHELVHIVFSGLQPNSETAQIIEAVWESAIERIAEAIQSLTMDYLEDVVDVDVDKK